MLRSVLHWLVRVAMLLATAGFGLLITVGGWLGGDSLAGGSRDSDVNAFGLALIPLGLALVITALFMLRRQLRTPVLVALGLTLLSWLSFVSFEGVGNEADGFALVYAAGLGALYWLNRRI